MGLAVTASEATAQSSLAASVASDYRYRGYSLTAERPALVASWSYDHGSGAYASISAVGAVTAHDGLRLTGYQAYAGYAGRFRADSSWEMGVSRTEVTQFSAPRYKLRYQELYAGVGGRVLSAYVYYSPNYLGENTSTLYATTSLTLAPRPKWKTFASAGLLVPVAQKPAGEIRQVGYDARLGIARRIGDIEVQAALSHFGPNPSLAGDQPQRRTAATVSTTYFF